MPYIKLLTALAGLALLTACGGAAPTATGDPSQTTDCAANPFGASCIAEDIAAPMRLDACLADITTNPLCTGDAGIATVFCKDDPFNTATACMADTYFPDRVADCITDGNAGESKCNTLFTASASNTCLTNPFTDACTSDTEFDDYADDARTNRVSFCASDNTGSSLCTALTTCQTNPFHASCGAYFESAKNPYCGNNPTATSCVNTTVWLASFTAGTAPPAMPNTPTRVSQFLAGTTTGFNTGANAGIRNPIADTTTDVPIQSLTFASADTATGGFAYFGGGLYDDNDARVGGLSQFYYAGVLAGTNLGAPITEIITTEANIRWDGEIRVISSSSNAVLNAGEITDFGVNITFDATRETKGTIKETFAADPQFVYEIDGVFDENGIITGTVDYGAGDATNGINPTRFRSSYSPGTLRGIIGQNGAVGVFHSDNDNPAAGSIAALFSGGFVVTPPAN